MEYTSSGSSWREAVRRAITALRPGSLKSGWAWGVPMIALVAGVLFTVSATTAAGTVLREDRRLELNQLIDDKGKEVDDLRARAEALRSQVNDATNTLAQNDGPIAQAQARAASYEQAAGLTALRGPGVTVRLDDSSKLSDGSDLDGAQLDQYVIHQEDVQAVVNALWAGGAEAMTIMNDRVISTSAVRCVGNTLLLHGRRYSPEFVISAIGDPQRLRAGLAASSGVRAFEEAAQIYGLGYSVTDETDILAPAYRGSIDLRYAKVPS